MVQSVKHLILDFCSSRDVTFCGMESHVRLCADSVEPAWDFLSLPLCISPTHTLSLKINKSYTESGMVVVRDWGEGKMGSYRLFGIVFLFCKILRVLEMDVGDGCTI